MIYPYNAAKSCSEMRLVYTEEAMKENTNQSHKPQLLPQGVKSRFKNRNSQSTKRNHLSKTEDTKILVQYLMNRLALK